MKFTPEHCANISKGKKGQKSWNAGTAMPKEKRKAINLQSCRNYRAKYPERIKTSVKRWQLANRERCRENLKKWRKANPRSKGSQYSYDLQDAMNNVRIRDKNTCQWQKCGLTFRQTPIHVHHIFPRKEYPHLELVEQYMICYCLNHHGLFHRYRGDMCHRFFLRNKSMN